LNDSDREEWVLSADEFVHHLRHEDRTITLTWVPNASEQPSRVYALAFTPDGHMLLVSDARDGHFWLPGGGIEAGESAERRYAADSLRKRLLRCIRRGCSGAASGRPLADPNSHLLLGRITLARTVPEFETRKTPSQQPSFSTRSSGVATIRGRISIINRNRTRAECLEI
jgi:hypothetical protein